MAIISIMTALTLEETEAAHARQKKRYRDDAAAKQYSEREHIRSEIPTRKIVKDLIKISDTLQLGYEERETPSGETIREELDTTRQQGLYKSADIKFKLLNKTVPDLKQIEIRADITEEALPQAITYTIIRPELHKEETEDAI